jgi:hypothetical protein
MAGYMYTYFKTNNTICITIKHPLDKGKLKNNVKCLVTVSLAMLAAFIDRMVGLKLHAHQISKSLRTVYF